MGEHEHTVTRILVAVDASAEGLSALEKAASLAARLQAHLDALFVEDVNLFHLAELPFARELDRTSGADRPLDAPKITQTLQLHAQRVRRTLDTATQGRNVRSSLRIVRGHYVAEALEAGSGVDVLFLGCIRRVRYARRATRRKPGWVLHDGSAEARRAVELARDFCRSENIELGVLIAAADAERAATLREQVVKLLGKELPVKFVEVAADDVEHIREAIVAQGASLLVLPRRESLLASATADRLLEELDGPLVLVA